MISLFKKWPLKQQIIVLIGVLLGVFIAGFLGYVGAIRHLKFFINYPVLASLLYWTIAFVIIIIVVGAVVDSQTKSLRSLIKLSRDIEALSDDLLQVNPSNSDFAKMEEALLALNKNVKITIADLNQRTYEVESLNKEAQKEMEYKRNLISTVSHEIKTPLAVIHATACAIKDGIFEDNDKELDNIVAECEKATEMLSNVISIYQMEGDSFKLKYEDFSLINMLNEITNKFITLIAKYQLNLSVDFKNDIIVHGDKKMFERVLNNVIKNAITYTPEGANININIISSSHNNVLEIINTGVNIPEEDIVKIFEPFYRVDKSRTKSDDHGNGLGLYIVKEILTKHNLEFGEINIDNGVKFYIVFPIE